MWSINASLISGVMIPVAEDDLGFFAVLLADGDFFSELLVDENSVSAFRFWLGGVNGSEEEVGDGELVSVLTGMMEDEWKKGTAM
jgi:hypothetical protein